MTSMAEAHPVEQEKVIAFVKDYLDIIRTNDIEISHKRSTLKARVKLLSLEHKVPKDFANYLSLFLMVTKFIQVEQKIWRVNEAVADKVDKPGFLARNLFKFLFFTRDYNEYYKSPLVFNTVFSNNDYEVINKRKSIIKTLAVHMNEERLVFESLQNVLAKRYAFFRDYNNPSKYYYTKGDVFTNKQFVFVFLFKTLNYMGIVHVDKKGKMMSDYQFHVTEHGKTLINEYEQREAQDKRRAQVGSTVLSPATLIVKNPENMNKLGFMFNQVKPKSEPAFQMTSQVIINQLPDRTRQDFLVGIRQNLIRRVQSEKIPNLLA